MRKGGPIGLFARHPTAANLLMALMILLGVGALTRLNTQFFPDFGIDVIAIEVEWPGASAEDVDTAIVDAIEPEVRFLDGIKHVRSISSEGLATVNIEFDPGTDMQAALSDVETAVGQITILPEDSERPEIRRIVRYDTISRLVISGPYPEASLKAAAKHIRDGLLDRGIDKVDLFGARDEEIWVEVMPEVLRRLDLTLADIAVRIAETSQDLPSGETVGAAVRQIRSLGLVREARRLGGIEIRALENGEKIYLRDVAEISEQYDEDDPIARRLGQPAVELHIQRAVNADALELADAVETYLEELRPTLPPDMKVEQYDIAADHIRSRINLLLKNGFGGLVLVLTILFIFLNAPVAAWVAVGIPASILATLAVMLASGQSINMVSLFGLIMALGIIVDDAIVVAEHAETRHDAGAEPLEAAMQGARRMTAPVFAASLTTIAAFVPLWVISGTIGEIITAIPLVVIAVLVASLIECFLVLPGHLRWALGRGFAWASRRRRGFTRVFERFRDGPFRRAVSICVNWRYATLASAVAAFVLSLGMVQGGRVGFIFFPSPEVDRIYANVQLGAGNPRSQTVAALDELERALAEAEAELTDGAGGLISMMLARVGAAAGRVGGVNESGDHIGGLTVELVPSDERQARTDQVIAAWREAIRPVPGVAALIITPAMAGPPGREIDIRLSGQDVAGLKAAAEEVKELLDRYPGVSDIDDDLRWGKRETILEVTPKGRALGFNTASVGRQLRDAFEGAVADRFPRGDEEVVVRVQYPRGAIDSAALDELYLRAPGGAEVPLSEVISSREKRGFSRIKREDGKRQVAVTAEIDETVTTNEEVLAALARNGLAETAARYDLAYSFAGKAEEQSQTFGDMRVGAMFGLVAIYIILAWVFGSYTRPIVVISVIPLGFVGATLGHWLLGFDLTILSLVALIGLSGIVVNDSIILVSTVDERIRGGEPLMEAIVNGARDRLRAVILTSATTIGGLTPLLFETSLQAQFLIPMALTIVFGLMVTTVLVLVVVPALVAVQDDLGRLLARRRTSGAAPVTSP
ncbi:MAG: efflux RND transporter permease subunit [Alphaproteobacteria bacterium]